MRHKLLSLSVAGILTVSLLSPLSGAAGIASQAQAQSLTGFSSGGSSMPTIQDPLDTPQARKAIQQGWKAIPKEVKKGLNLPSAGSSKYVEDPKAPSTGSKKPGSTRPVNLQYIVDSAVARYGGSAAVAYSDGHTVRVFGDNRPFESFSTIKVPLSIAALRTDPGQYPRAKAAITYSDNAATTAMWRRTGSTEVDRVIAEGGSRTARPTNGWWGSTPWSTADQAKFAANLSCIRGSGPVLDLMGQVVPEQRWGIGRYPGVKFKSGWAQSSGRWQIRQLGRVPTSHGTVAVAITAAPGSGGYGDAINMTNDIADQLRGKLGALPNARCQ